MHTKIAIAIMSLLFVVVVGDARAISKHSENSYSMYCKKNLFKTIECTSTLEEEKIHVTSAEYTCDINDFCVGEILMGKYVCEYNKNADSGFVVCSFYASVIHTEVDHTKTLTEKEFLNSMDRCSKLYGECSTGWK